MFQTLIIIASIVVLSAAILTSSIVSAKNSLHQLVIAKTQTAMNDGTSQFQFWAQKFVARYGTEADWQAPSAQQPPIFQPMCATGATDCTFYETLQWKVTGATSGVPTPASSGAPTSIAENMTPAVDEQRISATITTVVSDSTGRTLYGGRTQEVTARVFDVSPYVAVTATRDIGSDAGAKGSSEGDTGGTIEDLTEHAFANPSTSEPAGYTDTILKATIDCANSPLFDETNPASSQDNGAELFNPEYRPDGDLVWAYEMPCTPSYGVPSAPPSTSDYSPPAGNVYKIEASSSDSRWKKGDTSSNSFVK